MEKGYGTSEEIVGNWLRKSGRRDEIVLATKAYQPMGLGPNDRRLSAYHLKRACDASLRRLQTDHIDVYQMHHADRATPFEEIWQAMEQLVTEGKLTYVGSSNYAGWDIATAQPTVQHRNLLGLVSEQSIYNLTDRAIEQELIPALTHFGIGLIPYSPLGAGLLAGKPTPRRWPSWTGSGPAPASRRCPTPGDPPRTTQRNQGDDHDWQRIRPDLPHRGTQ